MSQNDYIDLYDQAEIDNDKIEGYCFKTAPCLSAEITSMRATEYMLKYDGRLRRVYNFEQARGTSRMYVKVDGYWTLFLTEEAVTMLTYGQPKYDELTYVAQDVRVAA
jgi:hypothetical protein